MITTPAQAAAREAAARDLLALDRATALDFVPKLTVRDYCDGDVAPAMVRLVRGAGHDHPRQVLDLCKHHYEAGAAKLAAAGWVVTDDRRHTLAPERSTS